ncbi:hypothetical protein JW916_02450 [Candidatus Sumerlaeota bacterium]|nr:hypothetical protein [Candidatus Sumerlaeota bacterium]
MGTESLGDLLDGQPVSKDFLETLAKERKAVEIREKELDRREQELTIVANDIQLKLDRLEKLRKDLEDLYGKITEVHDKELAEAVKRFRAMDSDLAARVFNQMDLEYVTKVLKRMDPQTAGTILNAMVEDAEKGTDATERERKLTNVRNVGETLVGSGTGLAETAP